MERIENLLSPFLKSGKTAAVTIDDSKSFQDVVQNLKKVPLTELDSQFAQLDPKKNLLHVTAILTVKTSTASCSLDIILTQLDSFVKIFAAFSTKLSELDVYYISQLFRAVFERLVRDGAAHLGIDLFLAAISIVQKENRHALTEIHAYFLQLCLEAKSLKSALTLLETDVLEICPQKNCDIQMYMSYFFYGAVILASYNYFVSALRHIQTIFYMPGAASSNNLIVVEAYKKYLLLVLLAKDGSSGLPRPLATALDGTLKKQASAYVQFHEQYMSENFDLAALTNVVSQRAQIFSQDRNMGLIKYCLQRYRVKELHKCAKVFINIPFDALMQRLQVSAETLEKLFLDLPAYGFVARIDMSTNVVIFEKKSETATLPYTICALDLEMQNLQKVLKSIWSVEKNVLLETDYLNKVIHGEGSGRDGHMMDLDGIGSSGFSLGMGGMGNGYHTAGSGMSSRFYPT